MPKGRKNGCPVNIKDWLVEIQDKSKVTETWVRIFGLTELNRQMSSNTEDGSAETDYWEEPYITKRNVKLTLKGRPVVDMATGVKDEGQDMLDGYAEAVGCEDEATIRFTDPYGHSVVADYIVTDSEVSSNDTDNDVSWDLAQVGESEPLPYYQMSSIALKDGNSAASTVTMAVGDAAKLITIDFTPANASNKRFKISVSGRKFVSVSNITENSFSLNPISAGTATVTVTTVNGNKVASLTVTVTQS